MSPYRPNIQDVLAYEIKKEMADRYFGFRKLIEEDKIEFGERARQYSFILEKRISFDLIRIYILLESETLIHAFLSLAGLPADLFYDPYLTESDTIRTRVFAGIHLHGLTHASRFKNLLFDCYDRLEVHVAQYREKFAELKDYREEINEEIEVFQRRNDLGSIMGFLKTLGDKTRAAGMEGGMEPGMAAQLEAKMRIEPQLPVEHFLPIIPPLPSLDSIRGELKKLIQTAYQHHGETLLELFAQAAARESREER
ncbi:hypothetical protein ACUUL3_12700 [Thiovibrio sp. JS02]